MRRKIFSLLFAAGLLGQLGAEPLPADPIAAGRQVYLAEGCINCHSQYVRPGTSDAERWGPQRPLADALAQTPPLLGNRRQGPDLQNIANRRSREWQRLHLLDPRAVTPGSRMPAYAHLFAAGDPRGEALLAYLGSLGVATTRDHWEEVARWVPPDGTVAQDEPAPRALYQEWCATCHGADGRGGGELAARLPVPPRNLVDDAWRFQDPAADPATERRALARTIKFGLPGTTMAGHEYLSDAEVLALAGYVQELRRGGARK